jgi:hypothetical protein
MGCSTTHVKLKEPMNFPWTNTSDLGDTSDAIPVLPQSLGQFAAIKDMNAIELLATR